MASAEQMRERFLQRVSPPGPTDEKLAATLGLMPEKPADGKRRRPVSTETPADVVPDMDDGSGGVAVDEVGGGAGLEAVAHLFPAPEALGPVDGAATVKLGFPVPVPLMREVAHFKLDLSRHLNRRVSNHEIGAAALRLLPGDPTVVAELLRRHAGQIGLDTEGPPMPARRSSPPCRRQRRRGSRTSCSASRRPRTSG